METKKFISTLKGFKTRFTNKPNEELEKKSVVTLIEGMGGFPQVNEILKGQDDLLKYIDKFAPKTKETSGKKSTKNTSKESKSVGKIVASDEGKQYAEVDGKIYEVDTVKKTMKRVYKDFKDFGVADIALATDTMPMTVYQRYLRDRFSEDAPLKKDKLHFRGYRIFCNAEDGFVIEDTLKKYAVVETPFEGIPTPKELGDWFARMGSKREVTPEETKAAIEREKERIRLEKEAKKQKAAEETEEVDFEVLRRKVLRTIAKIRTNKSDIDPEGISGMIPFKRWSKVVKSLFTQWKNREIRYAKFLNEVERITKEETFVVSEKKHRSSFTGTFLPEHNKVGSLNGDKIEVDGKWVEAVPFLLEYLLFHEKRAMPQIMKYATGEISDIELIKNPIEADWKVEYNKKALVNNEHNARVLCMVYEAVGVTCPQDILYDFDLKVGDRVLINDGGFKTKKITKVERGAYLGGSMGWLLKSDKWIKLPAKESNK